jgi:hypothetical protein
MSKQPETIAGKADSTIGRIIVEAMEQVGNDGVNPASRREDARHVVGFVYGMPRHSLSLTSCRSTYPASGGVEDLGAPNTRSGVPVGTCP